MITRRCEMKCSTCHDSITTKVWNAILQLWAIFYDLTKKWDKNRKKWCEKSLRASKNILSCMNSLTASWVSPNWTSRCCCWVKLLCKWSVGNKTAYGLRINNVKWKRNFLADSAKCKQSTDKLLVLACQLRCADHNRPADGVVGAQSWPWRLALLACSMTYFSQYWKKILFSSIVQLSPRLAPVYCECCYLPLKTPQIELWTFLSNLQRKAYAKTCWNSVVLFLVMILTKTHHFEQKPPSCKK